MTRTRLAIPLLLIAVACGDDAASGPGTGLIDTFDGISAIETTYPNDATLDLDEVGVGRFSATAFPTSTMYLAQYPTRFTLFEGDITLEFRLGEIAPAAVAVTFWKSTDFSRYAQASVSFLQGSAFIGWYDEDAEYREVEFALPTGSDAAGVHTMVVRLTPGRVVLELDGAVLGDADVILQGRDGELAWGMLPNGVGSELIVEEFRAVPARPEG
jgi:hypothetical protein